MTNPPPAKKLKQPTIFESLKTHSSLQNKDFNIGTVDDIQEDSSMAGVGSKPGFSGGVDRSLVASAAEKRLMQTMDHSKNTHYKKQAAEESQSQESIHTDTDINESPLLYSDSDLEDSNIPQVPTYVKLTCMGTPITELNTYPSCLPPMGSLSPSHNHTVLIKTPYRVGQTPVPHPASYVDKWDANYVKLPCSPDNLYPVEDKKGNKSLHSRWELIQQALLRNMSSSVDLEEAILTYNTRYSKRWNFHNLHSFFTEVLGRDEVNAFFKDILPKMVELALQLPHVCTQPIPMLKKHMDHSITMSQKQVACLLANAFFCTFPRRNTAKKQSEYSSFPDINFSRLFQDTDSPKSKRKLEKLRCIINYFRRVTKDMPNGTITFKRQFITDFPDWQRSSSKLSRLHVTCAGTIEDNGQGMLQVDFANKYLGGGVLGLGCVQEEIRFLICPELIVSRLFTEELDQNECLIITGCERFSDYRGYSDSFKWAGNHIDKIPRDPWGRICTEIVAIDALVFRSYRDQFHENLIRRELNKAYCGFLAPGLTAKHLSAIATGNWGCGAFGGDLQLKALLQLLAASLTRRDLCYFTFGDAVLMRDLSKLHQFVSEKNLTVSDIYSLILQYYDSMCRQRNQKTRPPRSLYQYIYSVYIDNGADTDSTETLSTADVDESSQEARWKYQDSPDYAAATP